MGTAGSFFAHAAVTVDEDRALEETGMADGTPTPRGALVADGPAVARALQSDPLYGYDDLRGFLDRAEQLGQMKPLAGAHWDLEIGGITEIEALRKGPALLFDAVPGYPAGYRVA